MQDFTRENAEYFAELTLEHLDYLNIESDNYERYELIRSIRVWINIILEDSETIFDPEEFNQLKGISNTLTDLLLNSENCTTLSLYTDKMIRLVLGSYTKFGPFNDKKYIKKTKQNDKK